MSLRDILFIFFYKLYVFIGVLAVTLIVTILYLIKTQSVFIVYGSVLLKPFIDSREHLNPEFRFDVSPVSQADVNSEIQIMHSRELVLKVVQELNAEQYCTDSETGLIRKLIGRFKKTNKTPTDQAVDFIREKLEFTPITMSYMIEITKEGANPELITKIVNTYLDCYIDRHIEVHKMGSGVDFYEKQKSIHEKILRDAETDLKEFDAKWSIIDIDRQTEYNIKQLQILEEYEAKLRGDEANKQEKVFQLNRNMSQEGELTIKSSEFSENEVLSQLVKAYTPLQVEKERILMLYPESSLEYQDISKQLEKFKQEIINEQTYILKGIQLDIKALQREKQVIGDIINSIKNQSQMLAMKKIERDGLQLRLDVAKKNVKLYLDKLEDARIIEQKDISRVSNVSIASYAHEPSAPIKPKKKLTLLLAVFLGTIAGIGAAFGAYYLDHTIKKPEDLITLTKVPVLSSLNIVDK